MCAIAYDFLHMYRNTFCNLKNYINSHAIYTENIVAVKIEICVLVFRTDNI